MILALALTALVAQTPEQTLRRFALVAGANDGGNSRVTLRYAASDARAMSRVLTQLGGVAPADVTVVEDPSPRQLERVWMVVGRRVDCHVATSGFEYPGVVPALRAVRRA